MDADERGRVRDSGRFPSLSDETYQILGALFRGVQRMGCGFLESVYQECLETNSVPGDIPFDAHRQI